MKIYLLTHQREVDRKTNTGSLAIGPSCSIVERIIWDRVNPSKKLLTLIQSQTTALLYPSSNSNQLCISDFNHFIILDGTWQEAKKMFNQSDYLESLDKLSLPISQPSRYKLRRNQTQGGLCTIECIIELLKLKGHKQLSNHLKDAFIEFNN